MKQWYLAFVRCVLLVFGLVPALAGQAQFRSPQLTWIGKDLAGNGSIDGYYESLPADYKSSNTDYPLLVYLHGNESVGDPHTDILLNSIPKLISAGAFPESFKVKEQTFHFIVIALHYTTRSLSSDDLEEAINYVVNKYRADQERIYLTGMSRGGGYTWQYAGASRAHAAALAAIVPVAGAAQPSRDVATVIGDADLPVWATHNDDDYLVPSSNTITFVDWVNDRKPKPRAQITLFKSTEHEGWTATYDPASKAFHGRNIYEWMLQYTRRQEAPLPVTLTRYSISQSGTNEITLAWSVDAATADGVFAIERGATQTSFTRLATVPAGTQASYTYVDKAPLSGTAYYRLSQTDADGSVTYFPILKISLRANGAPVLALQPNPVADQAVIKVNHTETGPLLLTIFTVAGARVRQWTMQKEAVSLQQAFSFAALPRGSYVLQVQGKAFHEAIPFIKQ